MDFFACGLMRCQIISQMAASIPLRLIEFLVQSSSQNREIFFVRCCLREVQFVKASFSLIKFFIRVRLCLKSFLFLYPLFLED